MTEDDFSDLHTYRREVARGLMHTDEWHARMEHRQSIFDWHAERIYREAHGITTLMPPPPPKVLILPHPRDKIGTEQEWRPFFHWAMIPVAVAAFFVGAIAALEIL